VDDVTESVGGTETESGGGTEAAPQPGFWAKNWNRVFALCSFVFCLLVGAFLLLREGEPLEDIARLAILRWMLSVGAGCLGFGLGWEAKVHGTLWGLAGACSGGAALFMVVFQGFYGGDPGAPEPRAFGFSAESRLRTDGDVTDAVLHVTGSSAIESGKCITLFLAGDDGPCVLTSEHRASNPSCASVSASPWDLSGGNAARSVMVDLTEMKDCDFDVSVVARCDGDAAEERVQASENCVEL